MVLNENQKALYNQCIFLKEEEETSQNNTSENEYISLPTGIAYKNVKTLNKELYENNKEKVNSFLLLANSEISRIYSSRDMKFTASTESILKITDKKLSIVVYGAVEKNGKKIDKALSISADLDNPKDISINRKNV